MFLSWDGNEFQRRGAERLKALLSIVVRQAEGTDRCKEESEGGSGNVEEVGQIWGAWL